MKAIEKKITEIYKEKGLNGVYGFLKKEGIKYDRQVFEFGLHTNKAANAEKSDFLKHPLSFHLYSIGINARRTGYGYNILRGLRIILK